MRPSLVLPLLFTVLQLGFCDLLQDNTILKEKNVDALVFPRKLQDTPSPTTTTVPSSLPSSEPSDQPSTEPSDQPSTDPSSSPSRIPSAHPSVIPSVDPSMRPSQIPSRHPSVFPTENPTASIKPSAVPSASPTKQPIIGTASPTKAPVKGPTNAPVKGPTNAPVPTPPVRCRDSPLKYEVIVPPNAKKKTRFCVWVGKKPDKLVGRCNRGNVRRHCPKTCDQGTCEYGCEDSPFRFYIKKTNKRRSCEWVKKRNTAKRCKKNGVKRTCRKTCNLCSV